MSTEFTSTIFGGVAAVIKREEIFLQNSILTCTSKELCVVG
jgi:hypothetical protein